MATGITDFVMNHPLFSHHDHHNDFVTFENARSDFDFRALLGYAPADLETAAGPGAQDVSGELPVPVEWVRTHWPAMRTTGYGRAVDLSSRALFDLEYCEENFDAITKAFKACLQDKSPSEVYDYFVVKIANNRWILQDGLYGVGNSGLIGDNLYPDYYRFAWRMDDLFSIFDDEPISDLEASTGESTLSLDDLVNALNMEIDSFQAGGKLAALKIGIAYRRDLVVTDPTRHEAERAFNSIRNRKSFYNGRQQNTAALNFHEARPLSDFMFHALMIRAHNDNLPVFSDTVPTTGGRGAMLDILSRRESVLPESSSKKTPRDISRRRRRERSQRQL